MASINERRGDGGRLYVAQVRLKRLRPLSKTFHQRDFGDSWKEARRAAEAWAAAKERELRKLRQHGAVRADVGTLTFAGLVDEYLGDEEVKRLRSYDGRHRHLVWWRQRYGTVKAIEFPSPVRLRDARGYLRQYGTGDGPLSTTTTNLYLASVRACWNYGRAQGLVPKDSVWPPRLMFRASNARDRYLTDEELQRALAAARDESSLYHAAVAFAVGTGIRQSEQLRVRWCDIDEASGTVAVDVTKTKTRRRTHLPPAVIKTLEALRTAGNVRPLPTAYVFAGGDGAPIKQHVFEDAWQRIRKRAGLRDVRWHDLRHAAASFLIQNGATLAEVAAQLGHLSVQTTARYAHLVPGAKPTGADKLNEKLGG